MNPKSRMAYLLVITSAASGLGGLAQAQLQTAGDLFVTIDATGLPEGSLSSITNNGTLGGYFEATAGLTNAATIPVVATEGIARGIRFDGAATSGDFMQLVGTLGGPVIRPPAGLVGLNPTRSIEVWAYNPDIVGEETLVSWGRRGGAPDGSNVSFNYGFNAAFGAVGHWGAPDIGWYDVGGVAVGGAPVPGRWHHLVYTYDGTMTRVYVDGELSNQELLGPGAINTHTNTSICLATQLEPDGITPTPGLRGSLSMARVRIHDGVLSGAQVLNNYDFEKATFNPPITPQFLSAAPVHRYSFSEPVTNDAGGLTFADSIGTAHGKVLGTGASFTGSRLSLPGGTNTTGYGDLPNGLLSANSTNNGGSGQVTIEGWINVKGSRAASRVFDFGSADVGEVTGPGGGGAGVDFLFYTAQRGGDLGRRRFELRNVDSALTVTNLTVRDVITYRTFNRDMHFAVTWRESTGQINLYENGFLVSSMVVTTPLSEINDVNVWLGRANSNVVLNAQIDYNEVRFYTNILSVDELAGNIQAGPNTVNTGPQPVSIFDPPVNVTGFESYPASFTAGAAGTPPISFQWLRNGSVIAGATGDTYSLTATLADSGAEFSLVASNFANSTPNVATSTVAVLTVRTQTVTLKNRYTFNQQPGELNAIDVAGEKNGELRGGAAFTGAGKLQLNGTDAYVNLPNNLVTGFTSITIEGWVEDEASGGWARIFDFGNSAGGEDFPIGSAGAGGLQYMFLAFPSGFGNLRGAYTVGGGGAAEQLIEWPAGRPSVSNAHHIVWVSLSEARTGRLFVDGTQVGENRNVTLTPASLGPTVNNWLGRAQFNDPLFRGKFDEFSIYDGAMTPAQVQARFTEGPNTTPAGVRLSITQGAGTVTLRWPLSAADYFLQSSATVGPGAQWEDVFDPPVMEADSFALTVNADQAARYYRLTR